MWSKQDWRFLNGPIRVMEIIRVNVRVWEIAEVLQHCTSCFPPSEEVLHIFTATGWRRYSSTYSDRCIFIRRIRQACYFP